MAFNYIPINFFFHLVSFMCFQKCVANTLKVFFLHSFRIPIKMQIPRTEKNSIFTKTSHDSTFFCLSLVYFICCFSKKEWLEIGDFFSSPFFLNILWCFAFLSAHDLLFSLYSALSTAFYSDFITKNLNFIWILYKNDAYCDSFCNLN